MAAAALALLALTQTPAHAQATEAQVKAAYLLRLASFVRWPQPPAGNFRICTSGRPDVAGALGQLARNQQVAGRSVEVVQLGGRETAQPTSCQVLFLGRDGEVARTLLGATGRAAVLTVTDRDNGTRGGAIEFMLVQGKVRFAVNRREADGRQLELSSKLMDVAVGGGS